MKRNADVGGMCQLSAYGYMINYNEYMSSGPRTPHSREEQITFGYDN